MLVSGLSVCAPLPQHQFNVRFGRVVLKRIRVELSSKTNRSVDCVTRLEDAGSGPHHQMVDKLDQIIQEWGMKDWKLKRLRVGQYCCRA